MTIVSSPTDIQIYAEKTSAHLPQPVQNNWLSYLQCADAAGKRFQLLRSRHDQITAAAAHLAEIESPEVRQAREHLEQLQRAADDEGTEHDSMRKNAIVYRELVETWCDRSRQSMPEEPMNIDLLLAGAWTQLDQI